MLSFQHPDQTLAARFPKSTNILYGTLMMPNRYYKLMRRKVVNAVSVQLCDSIVFKAYYVICPCNPPFYEAFCIVLPQYPTIDMLPMRCSPPAPATTQIPHRQIWCTDWKMSWSVNSVKNGVHKLPRTQVLNRRKSEGNYWKLVTFVIFCHFLDVIWSRKWFCPLAPSWIVTVGCLSRLRVRLHFGSGRGGESAAFMVVAMHGHDMVAYRWIMPTKSMSFKHFPGAFKDVSLP